MNINWFPGHMKKTVEDIAKKAKIVDFYIEIIDSRIPVSSRNPLLKKILINKPGLLILNKQDLSELEQNYKWIKELSKGENIAILYNSNKPNVNKIIESSFELMADKINKFKEKGVELKTLRAIIVGIPNSGKSTFINGISGRKSAKTGNKPGITKTNQWIKLNPKLHLLDTPGILWHKFEESTALNLAFTGAIKDDILDVETLAVKFIEKLAEIKPEYLTNRYGIEVEGKMPLEIIEQIAKKRGAILKNNVIDYTKVANIVLDEFRKGKLGPLTLERL
ncbi:Ribosome biogenesis GTPase A [Peptoniphilus sp. ING2-D1G]|nr:Ribosome biogenesis GTPase A [Peptoniphilus sp. ING2-D1G]